MQPAPGLSEQLKRTRFDELAVLVMVAESGSLSAAAQRLGVPKSTVGRAIARIEEDLGVALVRRMARGQALTEPGRVLAALAAPHVAALRDVTAALGRESSEVYGLLRVTAPADVGTHLIAPHLPSFLSRYPSVRIEIEHTLRVVDLVREGIDLAVRLTLGRLPSSTLIAKKLTRMNLALYAGTAYAAGRDLPKNASDLHKHDHVVFYTGGNSLRLEGPKGIVKVPVQGRAASTTSFFCAKRSPPASASAPFHGSSPSTSSPPAASPASSPITAPPAAPPTSSMHQPDPSLPSSSNSARTCSSTFLAWRRQASGSRRGRAFCPSASHVVATSQGDP